MFPTLPVLESMLRQVSRTARNCLEDVVIVTTQHLLATTGSLFETMLQLGARPEQVYVQGKFYSTNVDVADGLSALRLHVQPASRVKGRGKFAASLDEGVARIWAAVCEEADRHRFSQVIVLDDGGHCLAGVPSSIWQNFTVIGIEQTTSGLQLQPTSEAFPIIQVASSAAKRYVEPPMVSRAVLAKLRARVPLTTRSASCGVIGVGNIGRAVASDLLQRGHPVFVYDCDLSLRDRVSGVIWCDKIEEVFQQSEYIFGCTGKDILAGSDWLKHLEGCKTLISCSSEDKEFLTALQSIDHHDCDHEGHQLQDVSIYLPHSTLTILRGGFPVNFDGSPDSAPGEDIQVTRGLLLGAILQAALCREEIRGNGHLRIMLDPHIQRFVVSEWLSKHPSRKQWYSPETIAAFEDLEWIRKHSNGKDSGYTILSRIFEA